MPQKGLRVLTYVTSWRWWTKSKANMQETSRWETASDKTSISYITMHKVDVDPLLLPVCVPIQKITLSDCPFCLKLFFNRRPNSWRSSLSCGKTSPPLIAGSMRMLPKPTRRGSLIQCLSLLGRHSSYTKTLYCAHIHSLSSYFYYFCPKPNNISPSNFTGTSRRCQNTPVPCMFLTNEPRNLKEHRREQSLLFFHSVNWWDLRSDCNILIWRTQMYLLSWHRSGMRRVTRPRDPTLREN